MAITTRQRRRRTITQNVAEQVERFQQQPLADKYAVVYVDATYVHLRRDTVENEAVYIRHSS